jgi:predicted RNA polymerase sigma factor
LRNWPKRAADAINSCQPYWALAAHLFQRMERRDEAAIAYSGAIGLEDETARKFLARKAGGELGHRMERKGGADFG